MCAHAHVVISTQESKLPNLSNAKKIFVKHSRRRAGQPLIHWLPSSSAAPGLGKLLKHFVYEQLLLSVPWCYKRQKVQE